VKWCENKVQKIIFTFPEFEQGRKFGRQATFTTQDYLSATSGAEQMTFIAPILSAYSPRFLL
jgi:hypothetical protein